MSIKTRISSLFKTVSSQNLSNSISGSVLRNYAKESHFRPNDQVRGITYKAIDKIGLSLSVYEPKVIRANGDALENHPLYNLFDKPNSEMTASDFVHMYGMLFEIYGETFWYLAKGNVTGKVMELHLLNPGQMEVKMYDGELIGYVLHKLNGDQIPFTVDEIIHDKRPNPFNPIRGMSVLERAAVYIDTEITTATFTLNYMRNNASPSGIVSLPDMDKETFKQFAAQWREGYEGPENAGKTAFIRGGEATFQAVGATLKDVDAKVTRDMAKNDVLMMLEVPKPLLGATDETGFGRNNVEALHYVFAKEKLEPLMKRLDRIYEKIARLDKRNDGLMVAHISPVPEDKEFVLKQQKAGVNVWLTVNEVREQIGLPPLPDGDKLNPINRPPQVNESVRVSLKKDADISKAENVKKINEEQENFRKDLVDINEIYVKKLKSAISKFSSKQLQKIIDKINATGKGYEEWLFVIKDESLEMATILTPIIIELMETQSENVAHFITGELLTISPETRKAVEQNILKVSGLYNEDTLKAIEATLSEGQTAGESLVKLKKRVEQVYVDAKGYRAERIARTESLKASNSTAELVYKQNGFKTVRWFANPGACEFCKSLDGTVKSIGTNFLNQGDVQTNSSGEKLRIDYSDITTPPLHPNCTCSLVPED